MVNVDIDKDLYEDIKGVVRKDRLKFPSIRHFVHEMLLEKMAEVRNNDKGGKHEL